MYLQDFAENIAFTINEMRMAISYEFKTLIQRDGKDNRYDVNICWNYDVDCWSNYIVGMKVVGDEVFLIWQDFDEDDEKRDEEYESPLYDMETDQMIRIAEYITNLYLL